MSVRGTVPRSATTRAGPSAAAGGTTQTGSKPASAERADDVPERARRAVFGGVRRDDDDASASGCSGRVVASVHERGAAIVLAVASRPHLLVLNQYYWPGREATAVLLTELCEYLAEHYDVTVITGLLHDPPTAPGQFERNGVRIVRVRSTAYDRRRLSLRGLNYLSYLGTSAFGGALTRRPDLVVAMTDPPIAGVLAVGLGGGGTCRWSRSTRTCSRRSRSSSAGSKSRAAQDILLC